MTRNLSLLSTSPEETEAMGENIGARLRGGEVIELVSDLGGGKTTFTKGLALGVGSADKVHSPSFTIENEYKAQLLSIHHLDFYRLQEPGVIKTELIEKLEDPKAVVVVEWADIVEDVLPENRLVIQITATSDSARQFSFNCPEPLRYLIEGLK